MLFQSDQSKGRSGYSKLRQALLAVWISGLISTSALAQDVLFLPVFGSQPDTGLQLGVAGVWEQSAAPDA